MLAVDRFRPAFVTKDRRLLNMGNREIHLVKGQRVLLVSGHINETQFFGIQGKELGLILLLPSLFSNNFNIFEV